MSILVDTSEAGQGDIDVDVTVNGQPVRMTRNKLDAYRHRFTFVPQNKNDHMANVNFNYDPVPGI